MFLLVYDCCTWDFIVTFTYIHVLHPNLIHPLHYSPSSLTHLLKMTLTGFSVPYLYCVENTSIIFTFLYPLHLTSSFFWYAPLNMTCFIFPSFIAYVSVHCSGEFCLGILPVNILPFNQSNALYCSLLSFSLTLYCSTVFSAFYCVLFLNRCDVFQYYSIYYQFFPSFPLPLISSNSPTFGNMQSLSFESGLLHLTWCFPILSINL
jgi:hypothetical protein